MKSPIGRHILLLEFLSKPSMTGSLTVGTAVLFGVFASTSLVSLLVNLAVEVRRTKKPFWDLSPRRIMILGTFFYTLVRVIHVYSQLVFLGSSRAGYEALESITLAFSLGFIVFVMVATTAEVVSLRSRLNIDATKTWNLDLPVKIFCVLYAVTSIAVALTAWPDYHRVNGLIVCQLLAVMFLFIVAIPPLGLVMYRDFSRSQRQINAGLSGESSAGNTMRKEVHKIISFLISLMVFVAVMSSVIFLSPDEYYLSGVTSNMKPEDYDVPFEKPVLKSLELPSAPSGLIMAFFFCMRPGPKVRKHSHTYSLSNATQEILREMEFGPRNGGGSLGTTGGRSRSNSLYKPRSSINKS